MDQYLFDRWQTAAPPFDGTVLCHADPLPVDLLHRALKDCAAKLKEAYGAGPLIAINDWPQHDSVVLPGRQAAWQELEDMLQSEAALYEARDGDDLVHRAFYHPRGHVLIRFDFCEKDDPPGCAKILGTFDLAAPAFVLKAILADCTVELQAVLRIENAKPYFDGIYAG